MSATVLSPDDIEQAARLFHLLDTTQREFSEEYDEVPADWLLRRRARRTPSTDAGDGRDRPRSPRAPQGGRPPRRRHQGDVSHRRPS